MHENISIDRFFCLLMSNFHQLQTYLSTNAVSLPKQLEGVKAYWEKLIGQDKDIATYLGSIYWANDHSQCTIPNYHGKWKPYRFEAYSQLLIRPLVLLWVPETRRHLSNFWLEISILIDSHTLIDKYGDYLDGTLGSVRMLTRHLHESLPEHKGIFLTDEQQDGLPWEGWLTDKSNLMWDMDAAWLTHDMINDYLPVKDNFFLCKNSWGTEVLSEGRWRHNRIPGYNS